jgi:hypothetical protein
VEKSEIPVLQWFAERNIKGEMKESVPQVLVALKGPSFIQPN